MLLMLGVVLYYDMCLYLRRGSEEEISAPFHFLEPSRALANAFCVQATHCHCHLPCGFGGLQKSPTTLEWCSKLQGKPQKQ
jgi:hypothetical protein